MNLKKSTLIYAFGGLATKLLLFSLNPLMAKMLPTNVYGQISLLLAINSLLIAILPFGFNAAFSRFYFDYEFLEDRNRIIGTIFYSWLPIGLILTLLVEIIFFVYHDIIVPDIEYYPYIVVTVLSGFLMSIMVFLKAYYQIKERPKRVVGLEILDRTMLFGLILTGIVLQLGIDSWLLAVSVLSVALGGASLLMLSRRISLRRDWQTAIQAIKFGFPIVIHTSMGWILSLSDRLVINSSLDSTQVAYYVLPYSIAQSLGLVSQAVGRGWIPRITDLYSKKRDYVSLIKHFIYITFIPLISISGIIILFRSQLVLVFGDSNYVDSAHIILPILILGFYFEGFYKVSSIILSLQKKVKLIPVITIVSALINLLINVTLISKYGIIVAAWATLIGFTVMALLSIILTKFYKLFYKELLVVLIAGLSILLISFLFAQTVEALKLLWAFVLVVSAITFYIRQKSAV